MKKWLLLLTFFCRVGAWAQDLPAVVQQQMEDLAETQEAEPEDDNDLQALDHYLRHPMDLNAAGPGALEQFPFLNAALIHSFNRYRELLGPFTSVYELQAVPGWSGGAAARLAPYVRVGTGIPLPLRTAMKGEHQFVLRFSAPVEKAAGYRTGEYPGSPLKLFFRYRYQHRNRIQWGLTADKDAGESFFKGGQRQGFDFYSAHLFYRGRGRLRLLALGDFIVNMGQGLVHWQGLALGRGGEPGGVKRQSPVLRPYTSSGEYNFLRGAGGNFVSGRWSATFIFSVRSLDASMSEQGIGSFLTSGYHRTAAERSSKGIAGMLTAGGNMGYSAGGWQWKLNVMHYRFSHPLRPGEEIYQLYAPAGKSWINASVDHAFTRNNFHLFGEWAIDRQRNFAFLQGILLSMHRDADLAVLFRHLQPGYQTMFGNAFNVNTQPSNETGLYLGMDFRLSSTVRMMPYADLHHFPWLKFRVDAPSTGQEFGLQFTYAASRSTQLVLRLRYRERELNGEAEVSRPLVSQRRFNFRASLSQAILPGLSIRARAEITTMGGRSREEGFLLFADLLYKPLQKPYSLIVRAVAFETGGYDTRIYAFENNVLYGYSIPALYGRGFRYYFTGDLDVTRSLKLWYRWACTIYREGGPAPAGRDAIAVPRRSDWTLQLRWVF